MDIDYSFTRYLSAKKTVDDRALNPHVWQALVQSLPASSPGRPVRVLEIGAGIGTMIERTLAWGLLVEAEYTAIDNLPDNLLHAHARLPAWGKEQGYRVSPAPSGWRFEKGNQRVKAEFEQVDLYDFLERERRLESRRQAWDLLVAHAFLDLVDVPSTLPALLGLLTPGGLFYFTLNFDGATLFEPAIDPAFDELVQSLYHRTMDERLIAGHPSGDSRTGRHLFAQLRSAGAELLAAGSSDWVVFPGRGGYPHDEAYFLHFIVHTLHEALRGHPELDPLRFERWLGSRHAQIERGELVYIAHQLDFVGKVNLV